MQIEDKEIRKELSGVLGSYKITNFYGSQDKDIKMLSWIEIAFEIGKLRRDSNALKN